MSGGQGVPVDLGRHAKACERVLSDTEKSIRKAFLKALAEVSPSDMTVSQLAKDADVYRSTFYRYYRSIDDLFESCKDEAIKKVIGLIRVHVEEVAQGNALPLMSEITHLIDNDKELFRAMLVCKRAPFFQQEILAEMRVDEDLIELVLGEVRTQEDLVIDLFNLDFVFGGMIAAFGGWLERGGSQSLSKEAVAVQAAGWLNVVTALCETSKKSLRSLSFAEALQAPAVDDHGMRSE